MHHPTDRITHITAFVTPVVEHWQEREIAQWVHPTKDRSDDPSHHERTLLLRSYISLPLSNSVNWRDKRGRTKDNTQCEVNVLCDNVEITTRHICHNRPRWRSDYVIGSSEVERSLMVRWVVGSIFHGVDPLSYFSFKPVLHDWCNKGRGMYCSVYGKVHIKDTLLLIEKSSLLKSVST